MFRNARYIGLSGQPSGIEVAISGVITFVPLDPANRDFQDILAEVAAGRLTIAPLAP
jgi:hypothetical protein